MSKILFSIENNIQPDTLIEIKRITSASISDIKRSIETGSPISEYILFYNDHDEVAQNLRSLARCITSSSVKARFFELEEDEDFRGLSNPSEYEISPETLVNILDLHDQGLLRQLNG